MKMNIKRLNDRGVKSFCDFLDSLADEEPMPYPLELLTDAEYTEEIHPPVEIERCIFGSRFAAAEYLYRLFKDSGLKDIERDVGLWVWLSLFYFDQLCPSNSKGNRKAGERARWIPKVGVSWRYYRHLLAGPYLIYTAHSDDPDRAALLLCGPLHQPGDIVEQVASRQEIITNKGILQAACNLYFDPARNRPKRGAASKNRGGAVRRFIDIINQFDVTWDLYSLNGEDLVSMLPNEFSRFISDANVMTAR